MPLKSYGVLKGRPIAMRFGSGPSPHYQVHMVAGDENFRIATSIQSGDGSEVEVLVRSRFDHPILHELASLSPGFNRLAPQPGLGPRLHRRQPSAATRDDTSARKRRRP